RAALVISHRPSGLNLAKVEPSKIGSRWTGWPVLASQITTQLDCPSGRFVQVTTKLPSGLTAAFCTSGCGPSSKRQSGRSRSRTSVELPWGTATTRPSLLALDPDE